MTQVSIPLFYLFNCQKLICKNWSITFRKIKDRKYLIGFVRTSRLHESPSKDSDVKTDVKEAEPLVSPSSNDEDKENVKDEGNVRELESKKPGLSQ